MTTGLRIQTELAVLIFPRYMANTPCGQVKATLAGLAKAENEYFAQHRTFAPELSLLKMEPDPRVHIMLLRGDAESFAASASHALCIKDETGAPKLFTWDSARGGPQQ